MPDPHIYIVTAEKSGDELGAGLAVSLKKQTGDKIRLSAIGGSSLASVGLESPFNTSSLGILGFVEGVKAYSLVLARVRQSVGYILQANPDAVVLVDSWGFMVRVAKSLKKHKFKGKIIKYVAPQVWAMREGRSKILARYTDHLLTIHAFDPPYFRRHGLPSQYVGNPVFDENYGTGNPGDLRKACNIPLSAPVLCVLFGSRRSEIRRLAEPFTDAVARLKQKIPGLVFISPVSDTISEDVNAAVITHSALQDVILLPEHRKSDCFALADVAIACSGTVTSQLASAGVPTVVGYKLNVLTALMAGFLFKPAYISIVNIAADRELMPEFMQCTCTGENLANAVLSYLTSGEKRQTARRALLDQVAAMRAGHDLGPALKSGDRAARAILEIITKNPPE